MEKRLKIKKEKTSSHNFSLFATWRQIRYDTVEHKKQKHFFLALFFEQKREREVLRRKIGMNNNLSFMLAPLRPSPSDRLFLSFSDSPPLHRITLCRSVRKIYENKIIYSVLKFHSVFCDPSSGGKKRNAINKFVIKLSCFFIFHSVVEGNVNGVGGSEVVFSAGESNIFVRHFSDWPFLSWKLLKSHRKGSKEKSQCCEISEIS